MMTDQEADRAVLAAVKAHGDLSPRQLEDQPPGNMNRTQARHAMQRLLVRGDLYVNDGLRLAVEDE